MRGQGWYSRLLMCMKGEIVWYTISFINMRIGLGLNLVLGLNVLIWAKVNYIILTLAFRSKWLLSFLFVMFDTIYREFLVCVRRIQVGKEEWLFKGLFVYAKIFEILSKLLLVLSLLVISFGYCEP